jgi:hypothetical protein
MSWHELITSSEVAVDGYILKVSSHYVVLTYKNSDIFSNCHSFFTSVIASSAANAILDLGCLSCSCLGEQPKV